jgi:uncharacterized phage protein (TIGR02218 family)
MMTGTTTVCRCWAVRRRDGLILGFTDHDREVAFDGMTFRADTGMDARALQQSTGLAVDNSEALGALSDDAMRAADLQAGRFDGASVTMWLVNWRDTAQRSVRFQGSIGQVVQTDGAFQAELRGLTEGLNKPQGLVYQRTCSAVLGDNRCRVDLSTPQFRTDSGVDEIDEGKTLVFRAFPSFAPGWFQGGLLTVLSGSAAGLASHVKSDRIAGDGRRLVLWEAIRGVILPGDTVRLVAGCDKRAETCRAKFGNFANFRGFPTIPGEDWLMAYPTDRVPNDGGRL